MLELRKGTGAASSAAAGGRAGEKCADKNQDFGRWRRERIVARTESVDAERTERRVRAVLEAQAREWGAPLLNHILFARCPSTFQGARGMWAGLDASGLLDPELVTLVNCKVAT
jgi:hypothetical protein